MFDKPKTKAMAAFLAKEKGRVVGLSIEGDGVFIYTNSHEWCDDAGSGTFRDDTETKAIKTFYERVRKGNGDRENPQPETMGKRASLPGLSHSLNKLFRK